MEKKYIVRLSDEERETPVGVVKTLLAGCVLQCAGRGGGAARWWGANRPATVTARGT